MPEFHEQQLLREVTRRHFFQDCRVGLGSMALGSLLAGERSVSAQVSPPGFVEGSRGRHGAAKAKSVIFLFMAGGPRQLEVFDPKPKLQEMRRQVIP